MAHYVMKAMNMFEKFIEMTTALLDDDNNGLSSSYVSRATALCIIGIFSQTLTHFSTSLGFFTLGLLIGVV